MKEYTADDLLVLAKRHHNLKRTYLLINPLQAKHLPVSPTVSLEMMRSLGEKIAAKYPQARLVIGFAETATAIAASVAGCLGSDCRYIHTTREPYAGLSDWVYFNEEHSHAVEQKIYANDLPEWIANTPEIIFVDDEISTGKTLLNIIDRLREAFPQAKGKKIIAASIINRLTEDNERLLLSSGVECEYLVKLNSEDFTAAVADFDIMPAVDIQADQCQCAAACASDKAVLRTQAPMPDPRLGVRISDYISGCQAEAERLSDIILKRLPPLSSILVLGTEEFMYPSLILARELEKSGDTASVKCHSTTRSPIGISSKPEYPIHSGYRIHSFYEAERLTYIYNLTKYDAAVVFTDTSQNDYLARADISAALQANGCDNILFVEGGSNVWQL